MVAHLFQEAGFAPEVTAIMDVAFERARRSLHDAGQPEVVYEVIAERIIDLTRQGERDPTKLCEEGLAALGLHGQCD